MSHPISIDVDWEFLCRHEAECCYLKGVITVSGECYRDDSGALQTRGLSISFVDPWDGCKGTQDDLGSNDEEALEVALHDAYLATIQCHTPGCEREREEERKHCRVCSTARHGAVAEYRMGVAHV